MMNEQTLTKLHEVKLNGMAEAYKEQTENKDFQKMSFEGRLSLLVDLEISHRRSNKLQRLIKAATFLDSKTCIEDIEYHEDRKLDKELILKLASGLYIQDYHNIILKGPTGSGRSFLASTLEEHSCRTYYKVNYRL